MNTRWQVAEQKHVPEQTIVADNTIMMHSQGR